MVIEHYRNGDPVPVYRRFREQGRMMLEGVRYISSWVTLDLKQCYQIVEAENRDALSAWMRNWTDIVEFEVIPVIHSRDAADLSANLS